MNLILYDQSDLRGSSRVCLSGRRAQHVVNVHRAVPGYTLRVGQIGGGIGVGRVACIRADMVELDVEILEPPPVPLDISVILAMPRPKCFRRVLSSIVTLGVKRLAIIGAYRVEKGYWESPCLLPEFLHEQIVLALEQAMDTIPPNVTFHRHFKPFMEDDLPLLARGARRIAAHPAARAQVPASLPGPLMVAFGPEGGFTSYEAGKLEECEFELVSLGQRILRVEQVVPFLLGRVMQA